MGATSVTGVSGPGSVAGNQKGSEHMSLSVSKLIGPRIMAAGSIVLSGTTGRVVFPALAGDVEDYIVILTSSSATAPYVSTAMDEVSDTGDWSFIVTSGNNTTVAWAVVKIGL